MNHATPGHRHIGALAGASAFGIGYAVLAANICPDCNSTRGRDEFANSLEWAALGAALGAAAGASLDLAIGKRHAVYVAPVLVPRRQGRGVGFLVKLSWSRSGRLRACPR